MENIKKGKIGQNIMMNDQQLAELAEDTMLSMSGKFFRELIKEKSKDDPDQEVIIQLKKRILEFETEKRAILHANRKTMQKCIDKYSQILLAEFAEDE